MKKISRRDFCLATALLATGSAGLSAARAQGGFPNRPIVLIAPSSAGGLTDILSRALANALGKRMNSPIVVENKAGAGGTIGMAAAARAAPDGYTLILAFQGPATVAPSLYPRLPYDTFRDFDVIGMVGRFHTVLTVGASTSFNSAKDVIEEAKRRPGRITYGSPGIGSTGHLAGELFQMDAGVKLNHVPYKGEAPALQDVAAGVVDMVFSTLAGTRALASAGRVHMVGVASLERASFAPDVPTISESGLPGFQVPAWFGLMLPKGAPQPTLDLLRKQLTLALKDPAFIKRLSEICVEPWDMGAEEFQKWLHTDTERWKKVITTAKIKVQ